MATAVKPYQAILDKYKAETKTRWRPMNEEEMAALRAAADDPDNDIKVTRFKQPPTVQDVIDALSKRPMDAVVVLSSDSEGNFYSPLMDVTEAHAFHDDGLNDGVEAGTKVVTLYPRR